MRKRRGSVTATELMAQLEQAPEYLARRDKKTAEIAAFAAERELACKPVVEDLRSKGVEVESVWDLYKSPESYPVAIPVLLAHLRRDYPERILQDIGHALPFKPESSWWDDFKVLYLTTTSDAVRDRLAAAMSQCAVKEHYSDLLGFVSDERLGTSRIYFLRPINRIGNRMQPGTGQAVIESLVNDDTLGIEATRILQGKSRSQ
jgi:hypothetical protein